MVIGVDDENEVHRLGEVGTVRARLHRHEGLEMLSVRALGQIAEHLRFDID